MKNDLTQEQWLERLFQYAKEEKIEQIGEQLDSWESFVRTYSDWEIWKDAYNMGERPEDCLDDEISYWYE